MKVLPSSPGWRKRNEESVVNLNFGKKQSSHHLVEKFKAEDFNKIGENEDDEEDSDTDLSKPIAS